MLNALSGKSYTVIVPFIVDGEYVSPDSGSVTYDVRGSDGSLLLESQPVTVSDTATEVAISVDETLNTKALPFEYRTVVVYYSVNSMLHVQSTTYRLMDWVNLPVTNNDVRSFMGLTYRELPDEDIDLFESYLVLKEKVGTALDNAIISGTTLAITARKALIAKSALECINALKLRLHSAETEGSVSSKRFATIDLDGLAAFYSEIVSEAISTLTQTASNFTFPFAVTSRTDPVTNE